MSTRALALICLFAFVLAAPAELRSEQLQQDVPEGFAVYSEQRRGKILTIELLPVGEVRQNWTEMLTTQIFFGGMSVSPEGFYDHFADLWKLSCPGSEVALVDSGIQNGYPYVLGRLTCPSSPASGKPEHTWLKAVEGHHNFYAVQKSWRRVPHPDEIAHWKDYLRMVHLCDPRLPAHACP